MKGHARDPSTDVLLDLDGQVLETVRPYRFKDAATLLVDFWTEVDKLLKEKGVL